MSVRVVVGAVAGGLIGALGAQILGEYEFEGTLPFVAGPLFGLVVAEVTLSIARRSGWALGTYCAAVSALGLLWAGRIDANFGVEPMKSLVWAAVGLGAGAALIRAVGLPRRPVLPDPES